MTNKLRMEFDSMDLGEMIDPMFNTLETIIEHILENSEMDDISTIDIVDYIKVELLERLEKAGVLSENSDSMEINYSDVYDTLEGVGTPREVTDYLNDIDFKSAEYRDWTLADYEQGFSDYVNDIDDIYDEDFISEEELMKSSFKRHAGL